MQIIIQQVLVSIQVQNCLLLKNKKEIQRIGLIVTTFGDFARVDQAKVFNESEIARKMSDIGPNTEEIITNHGVYVKIPEFMWYP